MIGTAPRTPSDTRFVRRAGRSFWSAWPYWLAPALLSLVLALHFRDPFSGEWDSLDYTVYSVNGLFPSTMLLGRILFIYINRITYLAAQALFGLQAQDAYMLFKYMVIFQTPLAIISMWVLARELTCSARAATLAALILSLSPFFIFMSGQAMTEIPSILILCVALTIHLRGLRKRSVWRVIAGAVLLGLGVNVREGVGLFGAWLALAPFAYGWKFQTRDFALTVTACLVFFVFALGPFSAWFFLDLEGYRECWFEWLEGSRREVELHPISISNFDMLWRWFFLTSPVAFVLLPFAMWWQWRSARMSPLLLMGALGVCANLSLITHYSMVLHGRYCLTGLPAIAPLVANFMIHFFGRLQLFARKIKVADKRVRSGFVIGLILVVAAGILSTSYLMPGKVAQDECHHSWMMYRERLKEIPGENSVVMASGMTVAINYWRGVGAGKWDVIGCGCGWPGNDKIVSVIAGHHKNKRRVFLDADPTLWPKDGWQSQETQAVSKLDQNFRFRRVSETIYEICPADDLSANDNPKEQVKP